MTTHSLLPLAIWDTWSVLQHHFYLVPAPFQLIEEICRTVAALVLTVKPCCAKRGKLHFLPCVNVCPQVFKFLEVSGAVLFGAHLPQSLDKKAFHSRLDQGVLCLH